VKVSEISSDAKQLIGNVTGWRKGYINDVIACSMVSEKNINLTSVINSPINVNEAPLVERLPPVGISELEQGHKDEGRFVPDGAIEESTCVVVDDNAAAAAAADDDDMGVNTKRAVNGADISSLLVQGCEQFKHNHVKSLKRDILMGLTTHESVDLWRTLEYMCQIKEEVENSTTHEEEELTSIPITSPSHNKRKCFDVREVLLVLGAMKGDSDEEVDATTQQALVMLKKLMFYGYIEAVPVSTISIPLIPPSNVNPLVSPQQDSSSSSSSSSSIIGEGEHFKLSVPPPIAHAFEMLNKDNEAVFQRIVEVKVRWRELIEARVIIDRDATKLAESWNDYYLDRIRSIKRKKKEEEEEEAVVEMNIMKDRKETQMNDEERISTKNAHNATSSDEMNKDRSQEVNPVAQELELVHRELFLLQSCSVLAMRRKSFMNAVESWRAERNFLLSSNADDGCSCSHHSNPMTTTTREKGVDDGGEEEGLSFVVDIQTEDIVKQHVLSFIESRNKTAGAGLSTAKNAVKKDSGCCWWWRK
jgi:hypothetical protein